VLREVSAVGGGHTHARKEKQHLHMDSHRVLLPRKQVPLASPLVYHCPKLWPCCCGNTTSHGVTGHLFSAVSFLPKWEGLGHAACPVIWSLVQRNTSSSTPLPPFLGSTCSQVAAPFNGPAVLGKTQPWILHEVVFLQRGGLSLLPFSFPIYLLL